MAKKKAAKKKVAKKRAAKKRPAARTRATAPACSEADLRSAAMVTWGGEGLLGVVEFQHAEIDAFVNEFPVTVLDVYQLRSVSGNENAEAGLEVARRLFTRHDCSDMPYFRVYGRVMDILLNHRGRQTCSAGDVFRVFLAEIPSQLEENHRQSPPSGQEYDVAEQIGRRTFNNRMKKLNDDELVRPTVTRESGRKDNYVLTEDGQILFDGWPALSEIPGLELHAPSTPATTPLRRNP